MKDNDVGSTLPQFHAGQQFLSLLQKKLRMKWEGRHISKLVSLPSLLLVALVSHPTSKGERSQLKV